MRNRQCSCGVAQIARLLRMTQIASIRAETANKKLSKSSSQNYPNSFSENAKAPAAKSIRRPRKQFGERRWALGEFPVSAIFRLPRCKSACILFIAACLLHREISWPGGGSARTLEDDFAGHGAGPHRRRHLRIGVHGESRVGFADGYAAGLLQAHARDRNLRSHGTRRLMLAIAPPVGRPGNSTGQGSPPLSLHVGNQRKLAHCVEIFLWQVDKKQGLSSSIVRSCEKCLKGYPDSICAIAFPFCHTSSPQL
jgi:hypothetical protein